MREGGMGGELDADRITVLEDMEKIKKLKALYCYLADEGIAGDPSKMDELISHCTEDVHADFGELGIHAGKEAVRKFYKEVAPSLLSYSAHMVSNPIIEVEGDRAKGRWYVFVPCTLRATGSPAWLQAKYEEEYVKVSGEWMWKTIIARFDFFTPYGDGWGKTRMIG